MSTREEILREIGITPIWRLGHGPDGSSTSAAAQNNRTAQPAVEYDSLENAGQLRKSSVSISDSCVLSSFGGHVVLGSGDHQADWLFVGEQLEVGENLFGETFSGEVGTLLDNMLSAMNLRRDNKVYLLNVVQSPLPNGQEPDAKESVACTHFLEQQIQSIQPSILVALGSLSAERLIKLNQDLSDYRQVRHESCEVSLVVTYHPQDLLENSLEKANVWKDLCFAMDMMNKIKLKQVIVS